MARIPADKKHSDAIGRLFAKLTDELEHAHQLSVEGQNGRASITRRGAVLAGLTSRLERCSAIVTDLAELLQP